MQELSSLIPKACLSLASLVIAFCLVCMAVNNRQAWNENKNPASLRRSEEYFEYGMAVAICVAIDWMFEALEWFLPILN